MNKDHTATADKIRELIPRLKTLSFGMPLLAFGPDNWDSYYTFYDHATEILYFNSRTNSGPRQCSAKLEGFKKESYHLILTEASLIKTPQGNYKLRGHPITPSDICKILPKGWIMKWDTNHFEIVNMEGFGTEKFKNEYCIYEDKPFFEQSKEAKEFIAQLLK